MEAQVPGYCVDLWVENVEQCDCRSRCRSAELNVTDRDTFLWSSINVKLAFEVCSSWLGLVVSTAPKNTPLKLQFCRMITFAHDTTLTCMLKYQHRINSECVKR
ncbi:hypothetical protein CBL_07273 [Carabus blaptoides fortunei]